MVAVMQELDPIEIVIPMLAIATLWKAPQLLLGLIPLGPIFFIAERMKPYRRPRTLAISWRTDLYHSILSYGLAALATTAAVVALGVVAAPLIGSHLALFHRQPIGLQFAEGFVLSDLCMYVEHRMAHGVPLLWRFHSVHHSIEDLDWLSGYRSHPVDLVLANVSGILPMYLLGVPVLVVGLQTIILGSLGPWGHANLNVSLGRFWWVVRNPEFHRWHHSKERIGGTRHHNANFAVGLPIWDLVFRTCYSSPHGVPGAYGISRPMAPRYWDQILDPFHSRRSGG